jgi:hypothetical protein
MLMITDDRSQEASPFYRVDLGDYSIVNGKLNGLDRPGNFKLWLEQVARRERSLFLGTTKATQERIQALGSS